MPDDVLDDLFHFCALRAYLEQAAIEGGMPNMESILRRAYSLYESALADRSRAKSAD